MGRGFAVIDLETTGLFPQKHDRIVEVAIVHVSPEGIVEGVWETLVNPMRDMGAQRIHGISAAAVARAPSSAHSPVYRLPSTRPVRSRTTPVSTRGSWPTRCSKPVWPVPSTSTGCARCSSRAPSCRAIGVSPTAALRSDMRCRTLIAPRRMPSLLRRSFAPISARVTIPHGGMGGSRLGGNGRMSRSTRRPGWRARTPTRRRGRFSSGCTWTSRPMPPSMTAP